MTLDLSPCGSENVYIVVPSVHNSPFKDGSEDVEIPFTPLRTVDAEAPVWEVPDDIVVDTDPGEAAASVTYFAVAMDNVGVVSSSCEPPSGATFSLGTTTVECTASDSAGNVGAASFDVTVIDSEAPVWNVPSDISVSASDLDGATVFYQATASDNVGVVSSSCTPPSGATFPVGTTTVDCRASDAAGNIGSAAFDVTVAASVDTLTGEIENLELDQGVQNSLLGRPLQAIEELVTDSDPDNDAAACQLLDIFTMKVAQHRDDGSLTQAQADALTAFAEALLTQYNC